MIDLIEIYVLWWPSTVDRVRGVDAAPRAALRLPEDLFRRRTTAQQGLGDPAEP